jgi:hypothetical protein
LIFTGKLFVKPEYDEYTLEIMYDRFSDPVVKILYPEILPNAPHMYRSEGTLCLFRPKLFHWNQYNLISEYIMGWVAAWIYFYEIWKETNIWYGPEAPHDNETTTEKNEKNTTPTNH